MISRDNPYELADTASRAITNALGSSLDVVVVLGSGWSNVGERMGIPRSTMDLVNLPGAVPPTVTGHSGMIRAVELENRVALLIGGRSHLYEGHTPATVVHVVRSAVLAGCERVILTNAAGSLRRENQPGTPVLLRDQLNLTGTTPMIGVVPPPPFAGRFVDLTEIYSAQLRAAARSHDPSLTEGVYAGLMGGAYETPAEIDALRGMGADLVGMSTVLEAIAAKHLGAEVAGISLVTNLAAGMASEISHAEVLDVASAATDRIAELVTVLVSA